jgi:hypothetical protein
MALSFLGKDSVPNYLCLSTDISGETNQVVGAAIIGGLLMTTDAPVTWYMIQPDLTLAEYTFPISFAGTVNVGEVSIDQTTPGTTNKVSTGVSAAGADGIGNHMGVINAPGSVNSAPLGTIPLVFNGTSFDRVRGDATNGMKVQASASENHIGSVTGLSKNITVTPTLSVGTTYATGDYVGTSGTPIDFALAARVDAGTGWVVGALLENDVAEAIAMELWLFDTTVTPPTDSAAWSISDADAKKCIGVLKFDSSGWCLSALNAVCRSTTIALPFTCGAASKSIYGCLVARGSLTGALTIRLNVSQD